MDGDTDDPWSALYNKRRKTSDQLITGGWGSNSKDDDDGNKWGKTPHQRDTGGWGSGTWGKTSDQLVTGGWGSWGSGIPRCSNSDDNDNDDGNAWGKTSHTGGWGSETPKRPVQPAQKHDSIGIIHTIQQAVDNLLDNSRVADKEMSAAKQRIINLEADAKQRETVIELLKIQCEDHKKALRLADTAAKQKISTLEAASKVKDKTIELLKIQCEDKKKALSLADNVAKQKISAAKEMKTTIDLFKVERDDFKKALIFANAEIDLLRQTVASPTVNEDLGVGQNLDGSRNEVLHDEIRQNQGNLHQCYHRCIQENRQLKLEVSTQRIQLESCQDQNRLNQNTLSHEITELKKQMRAMEGNLDVLTKQLETERNDMQDMESLNKVLVVKERKTNDELQEARIELISGFQDLFDNHPTIGIKRMGELNPKPFRDMCMQKFATEDWNTKSAELCSLWQERIKDSQWFPFKVIKRTNGEYDRIIDDKDDELKQLKNDLGEQVYKAVCCALSEMNVYNPSSRCAVPELWNLKEDRKAQLKEVIGCLQKNMKVPKRTRFRRRNA